MKLFMDIHVIQTVPPSCLNRDDTGSPKTAMYGGARRARVSSQAWKRAMRLVFNEHLNKNDLSYRTKQIFDIVANKIVELSPSHTFEGAIELSKKVFEAVKVIPTKKDKKSKATTEENPKDEAEALFFLSDKQATNLAEIALGNLDDKDLKKAVTESLKNNNGVDLALFGRMVASNPEINCDASSQIAHAISTHRVENEYDYFTALDDYAQNDHAGGSMIGTIEYNSATLYRYGTVAVHELFCQLSKDASALENALREFVRAFIVSMPGGKQNTFAAHTLPHAVMVSLRTDRPLNFADAFESPISFNNGFATNSTERFASHAVKAYEDFCTTPEKSYVIGDLPESLGKKLNLDELMNQSAEDAVKKVNV